MATLVLLLAVWLGWSCWRRGLGHWLAPTLVVAAMPGVIIGTALASAMDPHRAEGFFLGFVGSLAIGLGFLRLRTTDDAAERAQLNGALSGSAQPALRFADTATLGTVLARIEEEVPVKYVAVQPSPSRMAPLVFEDFVEVEEDDTWQDRVLVVPRSARVVVERYYRQDGETLYAPLPSRAILCLIVRREEGAAECTIESVSDLRFCWCVMELCLVWLTREGFRCVAGVWGEAPSQAGGGG